MSSLKYLFFCLSFVLGPLSFAGDFEEDSDLQAFATERTLERAQAVIERSRVERENFRSPALDVGQESAHKDTAEDRSHFKAMESILAEDAP